MTDPTPTPDDWREFYKNPPPPTPPAVKKPFPKQIIAFAIVVPVLVLCGGRAVFPWSNKPTASVPDTRTQERPPVVLPPEVISQILSPTPTAPARTFTIAAPETLGGRAKNTDPGLMKIASDEGVRLGGLPQYSGSAAGFYGTHAKKNLVLVLAAAAKVASSDLDTLVNNSLVGLDVVKQPASADAGPLGGRAVCAEGSSKGVQFSVCGWVDDGSIGIIAMYYKSVQKAQADFHALRAAVEKVS